MMEPVVRDLARHLDDRGDLAEILRGSWNVMPHPIRQVYIVTDPAAFTVRAFHRHEALWDVFHIASGSALFYCVLPDAERGAPVIQQVCRVVLSARKPQILVVPPRWFHGWMSLEPHTILLSIASHEYNREAPDEERISPNVFFPEVKWEVQAR